MKVISFLVYKINKATAEDKVRLFLEYLLFGYLCDSFEEFKYVM